MRGRFSAGTGGAVLTLGLAVLGGYSDQAQAVSPRQLVEVVDFGPPSVSPDGKLVAFRTERASVDKNSYDTNWYVQPIDGSAPPTRVGDGGEPERDAAGMSVPEEAVWSPDGKWIFYRAAAGGRVEVWRAASDGSRAEPLTHDPANVRRFELSPDGAVLKYSVGANRKDVFRAEQAEYDRGIHINRTVPVGDSLYRSGYHHGRLSTQRHIDNELQRYPLLSSQPDRWKAISVVDRSVVDPESVAAAGSLSIPARWLGPDVTILSKAEERRSRRVAVLYRVDESSTGALESVRLAVWSATDDKVVECTLESCLGQAITDIVWSYGGEEVVFTTTHPGGGSGQAIYRWKPATGVVQPVTSSRGHLGGGGRWRPGPCAASREDLICVAADPDTPPRLERVALATGKRSVIFEPNAALAHALRTSVHVRPVSWQDESGTLLTGYLFRSRFADDARQPLFISYYRCSGFLRGGMGDEWPLSSLAKDGISALCINAPAPDEDAVVRYEGGRRAIESAVECLAATGEVDARRIGVGGLSFGAEVAMWTAMHSDVVTAVSVATPVISPMMRQLFSLWGDTHFSRLKRFWQLGTIKETPRRWGTISPALDTSRIQAPVLMQLSEQEFRSSLDYSLRMITDAKADVFVFPHEPHQKFQPRHKLSVYERNLAWFRFWLLDMDEPEHGEAEQFARWREMRSAMRTTDRIPPSKRAVGAPSSQLHRD